MLRVEGPTKRFGFQRKLVHKNNILPYKGNMESMFCC